MIYNLIPLPDGVHGLAICMHTFKIIKVNLETGNVEKYVGGRKGNDDGDAYECTFNFPVYLLMLMDGSILVAENFNHLIRKISRCGNYVITFAGEKNNTGVGDHRDGKKKFAQFFHPCGMCVGADDSIYVADEENHCIRKISEGEVATIAGVPGVKGYKDGTALEALFDHPAYIDFDEHGNMYVCELKSSLIRKIDISGHVTTLVGKRNVEPPMEAEAVEVEVGEMVEVEVGEEEEEEEVEVEVETAVDGDFNTATFIRPRKIIIDALGNILVNDKRALRYVNLSTKTVSTILHIDVETNFYDFCIDKNGIITVIDMRDKKDEYCRILKKIRLRGGVPPYLKRVFTALSPQPNQHLTDLSNMFSNAKLFGGDVIFSVNGEDIAAHKGILMARSEYFLVMFSGGFKESSASCEKKVEVSGTTAEAFKKLLMFLYTEDKSKVLEYEGLCDLIELANCYGITELEKHCLWFLESNMCESIANELLLWINNRKDIGLYEDLFRKVNLFLKKK